MLGDLIDDECDSNELARYCGEVIYELEGVISAGDLDLTDEGCDSNGGVHIVELVLGIVRVGVHSCGGCICTVGVMGVVAMD